MLAERYPGELDVCERCEAIHRTDESHVCGDREALLRMMALRTERLAFAQAFESSLLFGRTIEECIDDFDPAVLDVLLRVAGWRVVDMWRANRPFYSGK